MMLFQPTALGNDGHVQALTAGTITQRNGAVAYVGRQPLVTTGADAVTDSLIGGYRIRSDGAVRVTDATAGVPAGSLLNAGVRVTASGRLCVAIEDVGSNVCRVQGVACKNDGRVYMSTVAGPANSVLPVIAGNVAGEESSVSNGTWSGSPAFTYRWFLDGVFIPGATLSTVTTDASDEGKTLSAIVWATNDGGAVSASAAGVVLTGASPPPSYEGPLDLVPNGLFALSQRSMAVAFTTNVIAIRKAAGATANYAPVVDNAVSIAAVNAALGGADGFVPTLFDQSGSGVQFVQSTEGDQWQWEVIGASARPSIGQKNTIMVGDGGGEFDLAQGSALTIFVVLYVDASDTGCSNGIIQIYPASGSQYIAINIDSNESTIQISDSAAATVDWSITSADLNTGLGVFQIVVTAAGVVTCKRNGVSQVLTPSDDPIPIDAMSNATIQLGVSDGGSVVSAFYETVGWASELSAPNQSAVNTNITDYFS